MLSLVVLWLCDTTLTFFFSGEGQSKATYLTYNQVYEHSQKWARALQAAGVRSGDRVAGYLPNCVDAVLAMLGATTLGAAWCSASPDFGVKVKKLATFGNFCFWQLFWQLFVFSNAGCCLVFCFPRFWGEGEKIGNFCFWQLFWQLLFLAMLGAAWCSASPDFGVKVKKLATFFANFCFWQLLATFLATFGKIGNFCF